jgi:AraC family transcriptional regulator, regulatory protein of adaptative response / DNA-3-methyladenine glycosylase II
MKIELDICYQALITRDRRFDGLFFVAVRSTHIYCRPVCTVRPPQYKNCTFYENAASCERDGYRPCLRCRPELAPGNALIDAKSRLASRAINRIEDGALSIDSIEQLAIDLGVTSRHLRRVFESEIGVTPVQFVQTQRLLLAKRLLTDTIMPITQIAMMSRFSSVRRFNALFLERYRLNPSQLRKSISSKTVSTDTFMCQLAFRPPYDWKSMLAFLRVRACPGVEFVDEDKFMRTVYIDKVTGWLSVSVSEKQSALMVTLSSSLAPKFLQVLTRLKRLFDLQANPELIENRLGNLAIKYPGLRVPGAFDPFEVSVRAILGQQVSVKAASNLAGRLAKKFGRQIATPFPELNKIIPQANTLTNASPDELSALGIMPTRAKTIITLAKNFVDHKLDLQPGVDYESTIAKLTALPGIGEWTAQYIAMRCLAWPDAFPHGDLGIKKSLGITSKKVLLQETEKYRPWRAYAAMHIWKSLETNKLTTRRQNELHT